MAFALITTSCKKDDDDPAGGDDPVIVLDGVYVKGAGTALTDYDAKGMMKITRNEVTQEDRASLLELYVAVKGGADGFNIIIVEGDKKTIYGPGADFAEVTELDVNEPQNGLQRGSAAVTETKFTVDTDGLYHVVFDTDLNIVTIAKVEWGLIGAATPGGWGESTQLTAAAFDLNTMVFTATDLKLIKGDFKYRYSNGWKVILDADIDLGGGVVGVKVNSNYGGATDALVPGGANIVNDAPGFYTVTMTWVLGSATTANLAKTGDLEIFDYSAVELGLVGDGIIDGGAPVGWEATILNHVPAVSDETTYTWTYTGIEVSADGTFKFREGQDWNGKVIGYPDVTMGGTAAGDFETNDDGNFVPTVGGTYDFELVIDAVTEIYTLNVKAAGAADPEMYMLGDGCAAGWDNTLALPLVEGEENVYSITTELNGTDTYIKFITTLGQWAPMYGTDENGTVAGGTLVFRETESDPDPASIPSPEAGTYTITVNLNDMTYSILN